MCFKSTCIDAAIKQLEDVLLYFEKYRKECFIKSMDLTKKKSGELQMNVDLIFPTKHCVIRKKKIYFRENNEEHENMSSRESFRVD